MQIAVILPAAGMSKRFHAQTGVADPASKSKIEYDLAGKPVFVRALELFDNRPRVAQIIIAVNPDTVDEFRFRWADKLSFFGVSIVAGGKAERWETVLKALDAVKSSCTHVAVHDAARPLTSSKLIDRVFDAAEKFPAVIPGLPVSATLKRVANDDAAAKKSADPLDAILGGPDKTVTPPRRVVGTVDRSDLVEVQTPQVFEISLLRRAYAPLREGKLSGKGITDDAGLIESLGEPVYVVDGEATNLKITRPDDLKLAEAFVRTYEQQAAVATAKKKLFADDDE